MSSMKHVKLIINAGIVLGVTPSVDHKLSHSMLTNKIIWYVHMYTCTRLK